MKKRFVVIACMLSGALALSLSACGSNGNDNAAQPSSTSEAEASDAEAVAQPETENETGGSAMSDDVNTGMANPWVESSAEEIMEVLGLELAVPEGAENVTYYMNQDLSMEEMRFNLDGCEYTARVCPATSTEIEDISGMYYDWDNVEETDVSDLSAQIMFADTEDGQAEVILWLDVVPGLSYSLSTTGTDLNGLDIAVIASMVYQAMQGDVG